MGVAMWFNLLLEPAQTQGYMIAGYVVIFGIMLTYLVSLIVRNRNLHQELDLLEEIDKKKK